LIEPLILDEEGNVTLVDAITVDRIRELTLFTQLSTHRRRAKVAVIAPAETMNAAASNALLKTLEEPPDDTYLMLVSHQSERLPPTIVSRCRRLPVPEPDSRTAAAWLSAQGVADADRVLAQAGGAPLLALDLADPTLQRECDGFLSELERPERLSPVAIGARFDAAAKDERKALLAAAVYWLMTWTADLASVVSGGPPGFHPQTRGAVASLRENASASSPRSLTQTRLSVKTPSKSKTARRTCSRSGRSSVTAAWPRALLRAPREARRRRT